MKSVISCLLDISAIFGLIVLMIAGLAVLYFIVRTVFLDIKGAEEFREYYSNKFESKYNEECKRLNEWYEHQLSEKSKEYFKQFYKEEMAKKKEEKNEST